ncbi:putative transmembrane protein, partial [Toxoplasma gondii FOU]
VGISLPSLPCPPPSAQGPPASLGPFLSATQPWAPSLALSLSLACPLAYYLGSVAVPSHLFGPATPQRLSLPLLPFPASSHAVTHPLADLCRVLPSSRSSGESGASAGGLGASGRETGSAPQTSGDSRAGASAPEANPQGPLAATAVGGDKGREVKGRETKSLKADEGRIEISVLSPTLWPSYLQPVEEVFDTPQPFLDSSSVATGAAAAADAAGGGGTWLPIQQLLLQIKRLGRLRDRIAGFASLASAVTEFTSPSFSLFCLAYLLLSLLFLPSRFLAFLLFPALLVVLSRHPRAGICLLDFLTEFPLFMLFTPRRMQLQVLLSPSSSASRDSRPLACMLVLLLKHHHASWQLDPAASGSINGSDNPPQNCETFLSESPLSRASSAPPRPSCKGDSCGRCTQAEGLKHGKRKPQAEAPSRRFSWSVCGCFSPCCSPWRLPPPLPRLLLPSYEREEKDFWSTCRERGKFAELVVSTLHWTRLLLAFSVAGGAPQLSPAVAGLLCADCDFVPACGGSRSGRRGTSEGGQEARDEAARSSETRRETEEATGAEPPRSKDDRQREWREEERGGKGEDEEREDAQEGEGEGGEGEEGEEGKEIQRGVRAQVDEEEVGGEEVAEEEEEEEGRREREKGGKEKVDEGEEQEEEEERKEGRKQDERSKDGEAVEAQYREEENQGASGGSKSVGNKMGFCGHACVGGDELGRTEALLIQEEAAGREGGETRSEAEGATAKAAGSRRPRESATTPGKRARFRDDDEEVEHWRMSPPRRQTARAVSGDEAGEAASEELDEQRHLLTSQNSWGQTSGVSATAWRRPSPGHRRRREYSGETGRKTGQALLVRTGGLDAEFAFRCLASPFEQAESQGSAWKQRSALTQSWGSCLFSVFSPRFTPVVPKATLSPLVDSPFTSTRRLCSAFPGRVCRASLQAQIAAASPFVSSEIFLPEIAPDSPQRSDAVDRCPAFSEKHEALGVASRFWRTKRQGEEGLLAADYGTLNTSLVVLSAPPFSSPSSNAAALEALLELLTVRRPSRESASLFLPSLRFSCFSEASRGPPAAGRESETVSPVSIPSSQSLENDIEPPTAYSFLGWGASAPEAVEGLSPPAGPVLPTAGGPDGPGPVSDPADLETVETPLAGSSLPGGELFALYREVRASSTRFLVKLWRWVVWGEKICNLFSWRNRSLTEVAFVFAALLLLLLACVPLQYVLAVWIVHAFISGQKRGLWKLLARNSARRHVEAAIFEICLGSFAQSCKSASTTAAYSRREESGKNESAERMRPRLQKAAARPQPLLPLLRFLTVPELQQLRLSLWRRCGVALPLETLAEALDETELAEALRRGREETTVSSSRWARTDWMTNLLLHAPTDVTHQTSAVAVRDSRAFWAGAELLPEETGALGSTGAETLGPACAAGAGVCGAKRRAEALSGYRLSDGASDSGEQETLGEGDSRELPGGLGAFTQVLFGHATQPSSGLENGEDRFTGQSAPMNAAVVDAVGGAFMQ